MKGKILMSEEIIEKIKTFLFYAGMLILHCLSVAIFFILLVLIVSWSFSEIIGKDNIRTIDKATTKFINTQIKNLEDYANDR